VIQGRRGAWRGWRATRRAVPAQINDSKTLEGQGWSGIRGSDHQVRDRQFQTGYRFGTQGNRHHVRPRLARRHFASGLSGGRSGTDSVIAVGLRVLMDRQAMLMFRMGVVAGRVEVQRYHGARKRDKNKRQSNAETAAHSASVVTDTCRVNVPMWGSTQLVPGGFKADRLNRLKRMVVPQ